MTDNCETKTWSVQKPVWIGIVAIVLLCAGLGVWGSMVNISGAIVASGIIQVESLRQVVQHPVGGVVGQINARNGQVVRAGDILVRFDDEFLLPNMSILERQLMELTARKARLHAERDGQSELSFLGDDWISKADNPTTRDVLDGQSNLFYARMESFNQTRNQMMERKNQVRLQLEGSEAQRIALVTQIKLIGREREDQESLLNKGLAQASRILALQREEARLLGQSGELNAFIATRNAQIIETDIEILRLGSQRREQAETDLQQLEVDQIEITEKLQSVRETIARLDTRAPVDGIVYGMKVHALQSVVKPAEPILYIVPQNQRFVVQARIPTIHVDQVYLGQEANLHFSAFDQISIPEITGKVINISADILTDERTGVAYYAVDLMPTDGQLDRLGDVEVLPGMPVEVFIKTVDRTALNYLIKPFTNYFNRAFREL